MRERFEDYRRRKDLEKRRQRWELLRADLKRTGARRRWPFWALTGFWFLIAAITGAFVLALGGWL